MKEYSRCKWLELIEGILLIILGIVTLVCPTGVFWGFSIIYGIMAIVTGVADIIFYVKMEIHGLWTCARTRIRGNECTCRSNASHVSECGSAHNRYAHTDMVHRTQHIETFTSSTRKNRRGKSVLHFLACAQHYRNYSGSTHDILAVDSTVLGIGAHRGLSHSAWSGLRYHGGEL